MKENDPDRPAPEGPGEEREGVAHFIDEGGEEESTAHFIDEGEDEDESTAHFIDEAERPAPAAPGQEGDEGVAHFIDEEEGAQHFRQDEAE